MRDDGTAFLPLFDFAASDSVEERRGYDPVGLVDGCAVAMTIEPGASAYFKLSGFSNATASGALPTFFLEWDMSNNEQSLPMFFSRRAASRGGDDSGRCRRAAGSATSRATTRAPCPSSSTGTTGPRCVVAGGTRGDVEFR